MARNIFKRFNNIKKKAGEGNPYAMRIYMQFFGIFGKDIDVINDFISKRNLNIVKFLEESNVNKTDTTDGNKNDEHKVKVIKKFIAYANELPCPFKVWRCGLFNSNADLKKFAFAESNDDTPKGMKSEEDFVKNRYYSQQKYFSRKAGECKDAYYENQKTIMLFSVVISVASVVSACFCNFFDDYSPDWLCPLMTNVISVSIAILSAATAYITSNDKLYQNLSFWIRYRVASEKLKSEYALYQGRCGDYNIPENDIDEDGHTPAEKIFRKNVEIIVQEANDNFTKLLQNDNNPLNGADITNSVLTASNNTVADLLVNEEEIKKKKKEKEKLEKDLEKLKEEKNKAEDYMKKFKDTMEFMNNKGE